MSIVSFFLVLLLSDCCICFVFPVQDRVSSIYGHSPSITQRNVPVEQAEWTVLPYLFGEEAILDPEVDDIGQRDDEG